MLKRNNPKYDERGFASMVIALILIIILGLLTVAFAQLARREQQNALARQLAVQANYAAESGINDVINNLPTIQSEVVGGETIPPNQCLGLQSQPGSPPIVPGSNVKLNDQIDNGNGVAYKCVLLNMQPPILTKQLNANSGWSSTFTTTGGILDKLIIAWSSQDGHNNPRLGATNFPPFDQWGSSPAVLEASLTPLSNLSRSALIANTFTDYMYPKQLGSGTAAYNPGNQAPITTSNNCSGTPLTCSVTISNLSVNGNTDYLLRIYGYYDDSSVTVSAQTATGGSLNFVGGQAIIDVTGVARNVVKRTQVSYSLSASDYNLPDFAAVVNNLCKREQTDPTDTSFWDPITGTAVTSGPCNLQ